MTVSRSATAKTAHHAATGTLSADPGQLLAIATLDAVTRAATVKVSGSFSLSSGTVLTVGAGMEFATLSQALNASVAGDTILVQAGTYVNDFCTVNAPVTILAMGGVVNEVATEPPPNDKGIIVVNADLTIQGFTFTGGSDGSPDGNVAGIRYQAGNLNVQYCDFYGMQEGLLATPLTAGTGTITINASEFYDNGTGDGYTHDIYVGAVASFTLTNSYIHDAIVGHEVKSRAAQTTIKDNVIVDGPGGTSSYEIDIPNGGVAVIEDNTLEKAATASNPVFIHYGGETQYAWSSNSLLVQGNTAINDYGSGAYLVYNQSAVNGLSVSPTISGNSVWNISAANMVLGAGTVTNNKHLTSEPTYSTASPWITPPAALASAGSENLPLYSSGNSVTGGASMLTVTDSADFNTVTGGAGGLHFSDTIGWDVVSTAAGATDTLSLNGRNNVVFSSGNDTIVDNGAYDQVYVSGNAKITAKCFAQYFLSGNDTISAGGQCIANVASGAAVTCSLATSGAVGNISLGSNLVLTSSATGGVADTITGTDGAFVASNAKTISLQLDSGNAQLVLGNGTNYVSGGVGNDSYSLQGGTTSLSLGGGTDSVLFDGGTATVTAGAGIDAFVVANSTGTLTINGYNASADTLNFSGFSGNAVKSASVASDGSTILNLTSGAVVDVAGVTLPGYATPTGGGGGTSGQTGQVIAGGATLLTINDQTGGNTIEGGSGGLLVEMASQDVITTTANASNSLTLGSYDTVTGGGGDTVSVTSQYNAISEQGAAAISLAATANSVQGGAGLVIVNDTLGSNDIMGGAGGLVLTGNGSSEWVTTAAGASDTISAGGYSSMLLAGNDVVSLTGNYTSATVTGASLIQSSGTNSYLLEGQDTLQSANPGQVTVAGGASATLIFGQGGSGPVSLLQGGTVALSQVMSALTTASATVSGGAAALSSATGLYAGITINTSGQGDNIAIGNGPATVNSAGADTIAAGTGFLYVNALGSLQLSGGAGTLDVVSNGTGVAVQAGAGNVTLQGGAGNDSFVGGAGDAVLTLGSGNDQITFGSGTTELFAGTGADIFNVVAGTGGDIAITGWNQNDQFVFQGYNGGAIASQTIESGNTVLQMSDGTSITLLNTVAQF